MLAMCHIAQNTLTSITSQNFRRYGRIIEYPRVAEKGAVRNLWRIVHRSEAHTGWRVAYLVLRDRTIGRMECHPDSDETFEPISGRAVLFVSMKKDPTTIEAFWLDKPVVLFKGTWHGLVRIDGEVHLKIVENSRVRCRYWSLGSRMGVAVGNKRVNALRTKECVSRSQAKQ